MAFEVLVLGLGKQHQISCPKSILQTECQGGLRTGHGLRCHCNPTTSIIASLQSLDNESRFLTSICPGSLGGTGLHEVDRGKSSRNINHSFSSESAEGNSLAETNMRIKETPSLGDKFLRPQQSHSKSWGLQSL